MKYNIESIPDFLSDILALSFFRPNKQGITPIEAVVDHGESKLVIISGDNASGKSMVRRIVCAALSKMSMECIHLSQQGRSANNGNPMRGFIYGTEEYDSTGYNSAKTIQTCLKTSWSREKRHCIFWDEPDIGLSDSYAAGLGVAIREFIEKPPDKLYIAFLVSHRKAMVEQLLPIKPWNMRLGGCLDLVSWLKAPVIPASPEKLHEEGLKRFHLLKEFIR